MPRSKPLTLLTAAIAALSITACGNDDDGNGATPPPTTSGGQRATIGVERSELGNIVDDSRGRTVYLFEKDTGTRSRCSGACAAQWPPVTARGRPHAGSGLTASKVGTTMRSDGKRQITYNGHPLYLFSGDRRAGDTNGQGLNAFGAAWYVVSPAGDEITTQGSIGGGGGSGY